MLSLIDSTLKNTKLFTLRDRTYTAKCVKCYDADTIHVVIELFGELQRFVCRLEGIDSAEIRTKCKHEKECALVARDYLRNLILGKLITIKCGDFDKYGRLLVSVYEYIPPNSRVANRSDDQIEYSFDKSINNTLITKGHAYKYDGSKKTAFSDWYKE